MEYTVLAFGLCAALVPHSSVMGVPEMIGIGQVKGDKCDMFFVGTSTQGDTVSMQGHAVVISGWDNGMVVTIDGKRFFVPRSTDL